MSRDPKVDSEEFWPYLEKLGEEEVRKGIINNIWYPERVRAAQAWLDRRERDQEALRADEALRLVKEANDIANNANRIAIWAFVVGGLGFLLALVALFLKVY